MRLDECLSPTSVVAPLEAQGRDEALRRLVGALGLEGGPAEEERFYAAVLAREAAGSTGFGGGVAIPHARTPRLSKPRVAVGRTARPLDFKAADGQPVEIIFLLAVPESDPRSHLALLAAIGGLASDKKRLKTLLKAPTADALTALLQS